MTIDPTPPSEHLSEGSTEGVRAGTKTKFNMVALIGGLALVVLGFAVIYFIFLRPMTEASAESSRASSNEVKAAEFENPLEPAKGDSPVDGDAVDPLNTRKDGPSDPTP